MCSAGHQPREGPRFCMSARVCVGWRWQLGSGSCLLDGSGCPLQSAAGPTLRGGLVKGGRPARMKGNLRSHFHSPGSGTASGMQRGSIQPSQRIRTAFCSSRGNPHSLGPRPCLSTGPHVNQPATTVVRALKSVLVFVL